MEKISIKKLLKRNKDMEKDYAGMRSNLNDIRNENRELNGEYNKLQKEHHEVLKEQTGFMRALVLHLSSKPIKTVREIDGKLTTLHTWREVGEVNHNMDMMRPRSY